jgi:transposase
MEHQDTMFVCGVDIGDRYCHICVLDGAGEVIEETRVRTKPEAIERYFHGKERMRVALEVGTHSPWISSLVAELDHEVLVANARKLRMIYENEQKDDRIDAEMLARVARLDPKLLAPIQHRGEDARAMLTVIRSRDILVQMRTKLVNHVRGTMKAFGGRMPSCSTGSFGKQVGEIPEELKPALMPVMEQIQELTRRLKDYDRRIEQTAKEEIPETEALRQVGGVGALTSLAYVLTLEDPGRFKSGRAVGSYLGLCPRRDKSGDADPQLHIAKTGDPYLRRLLVGSAHYILGPFGPDSDLRRWGLKLAERGGKNAKKRAAVAVARKLSVLLFRLWQTGEVYEPLRSSSDDDRCQDSVSA